MYILFSLGGGPPPPPLDVLDEIISSILWPDSKCVLGEEDAVDLMDVQRADMCVSTCFLFYYYII